MITPAVASTDRALGRPIWTDDLARAIRDPDVLLTRLGLPDSLRGTARSAARSFPLMVPESYLARIEPGSPKDPLLLQVLPIAEEERPLPGFVHDPLNEAGARVVPGLLQKYEGRALLIAAASCPVHCRYCFRRHYPYAEDVAGLPSWGAALDAIAGDAQLREVLLSGGDPLMLPDARLAALCGELDAIPHLKRLRIHTRMPVVLPSRVTRELLELLGALRLRPIVVLHANHPRELTADAAAAVRRLAGAGTLLNQAVLLAGVNDDAETQLALCERLLDLGALPYYLHQLDAVAGAAHFAVPEERGVQIAEALRRCLPGYAVPRFVREEPGRPYKVPLA
jgi:EF-P beta-lysylation protein EpmB